MSKQLKEEWREKYNDKIDFGVEHDFNVVDFFYSLHLENIKAIREQIAARKKEFGEDYDERSNCDSNYVNGYNQALDDVLLTIAE